MCRGAAVLAGPWPGSGPLVRYAVTGECVAVLPAGGGPPLTGGHGIGVLLRRGNLFGHLTVRQNVTLARRMAARRAPESALDLLELVGLSGRGDTYPDNLPAAEVTRAGLAAVLAGAPDLVLADEPTGELDRLAALELMDLLCAVARRGIAVVVATRDPEVAAVAHRIARVV